MTESPQGTLKNTLQGSLTGLFVEFDHLPWLLANLDNPGSYDPNWPEVLHSIRAGMDEQGLEWLDDLPNHPAVEMPLLEDAVAGARQLCERVGLIEGEALTDSGRKVAVLKELVPETRRNLLAPILAQGVEAALVGQDGAPLVPLLRDAAEGLSSAKSPWARQTPGLFPVEVAAIVHWACLDIERAHAVFRDIAANRESAMKGEAPPGGSVIDAEFAYDVATEFYMERSELLGW